MEYHHQNQLVALVERLVLRVNFVESGEMLGPHKTVVEAHSLRFVVGHSRRSVHDHRGNPAFEGCRLEFR